MEDIAPELYERIKSTYENEKASSKKLDAFLEKAKKGNAAYEDVYDYAGELGRCLESAFSHNIRRCAARQQDVLQYSKKNNRAHA